jgi:PST family polysaccharide transporter
MKSLESPADESSCPDATQRTDESVHRFFKIRGIENLKEQSVRGGVITIVGQGVTFCLQTGSMIVLARLLSPEDFGLQGMVTSLTGLLGLFRDGGLGVATVQSDLLTHQRASTLFWINVAVGASLMLLCGAMAPVLVSFYREPRLLFATLAAGAAFLINSLSVQHAALLYRNMHFMAVTRINLLSLAGSTIVGITMGAFGFGYWSLIAMALSNSVFTTMATWHTVAWMPGSPKNVAGVGSMLRFGGTVTLNSLVVYVAYNVEKILLGRFWGAPALGLYGRAYQFVNLPVQQLNTAIGSVAFPAFSRIQQDSGRIRKSFLKSYSIVISLSLPAAVGCGVFADEIVAGLLGAKWSQAAPVLRLLTPAVVAFALVNPFGWFLQATGRAQRSLYIAVLIAPVVIIGIIAGLRHGPAGVAAGYSTAMAVLVLPIVAWAKQGTGITMPDYWRSVRPAVVSVLTMFVSLYAFKLLIGSYAPDIIRLSLGVLVGIISYTITLMMIMGQRGLYVELFQHLRSRHSKKQGIEQ